MRRHNKNLFKIQDKLKNIIIAKRNFQCERCGVSKNENNKILLNVFIKDKNTRDFTENNLIVLCEQCFLQLQREKAKIKEELNKKREGQQQFFSQNLSIE